MKHLDEGRLQALMDGELPRDEARQAQAHVVECLACRESLDAMLALGAKLGRALANLDPSPPTARVRAGIAAEEERWRASPRGGSARTATPRGRPSRRWTTIPLSALPRAAAVTLLLAGGAAAMALPGSPLRSWLSGVGEPADTPARAERAAATAPAGEVGLRVAPSGGRIRILLDGLPAGAEVEVRMVDAASAGVFAPDGARFRGREGALEVRSARGPVRVEVPRGVAATVSVGGLVYLEVDGSGAMHASGPLAERAGERVSFRVP